MHAILQAAAAQGLAIEMPTQIKPTLQEPEDLKFRA